MFEIIVGIPLQSGSATKKWQILLKSVTLADLAKNVFFQEVTNRIGYFFLEINSLNLNSNKNNKILNWLFFPT